MKALVVASVASMIEQFNMDNIFTLLELGYSVDVACNFEYGSTIPVKKVMEFKNKLQEIGIGAYHVPIPRNPNKMGEILNSYNSLKKLIEYNNYDIVHCQSPIGGVLARLASKKNRENKTTVIYTAHGFHFYKGAPVRNWMIYYPIEKIMSKYTDILITINKEDYNIANKLLCKNIKYINGIGIDTSRENSLIDRSTKRQELGIKNDAILLTSVGELSDRKNHRVILNALSRIDNENIIYMICGTGSLEDELKKLVVELGLVGRVVFAGYRTDIHEILNVSDCFVFPSVQEGLPVALMEAMAVGLPVICSKIRGNTDLVVENKGGYLVKYDDINAYVKAIEDICLNDNIRVNFGEFNKDVIKEFDIRSVHNQMRKIYQSMNKENNTYDDLKENINRIRTSYEKT
jgi:glycosyltransferase involved in cell wall biosynthesis